MSTLIESDKCPACGHTKHTGQQCIALIPDLASRSEVLRCSCDPSQTKKADAGKPHGFKLIPWRSICELAEVYNYGAQKYEADSWRTVPDAINRYGDALMRHTFAYFMGEKRDQESGLRHLAQMCWNVVALMELTRDEE